MQPQDLLSFCQERMSQAYVEQVWAVALVGGMCGFVISQAGKLAAALSRRAWSWGVGLAATLALLFVWSRHGIYRFYDAWTRQILSGSPAGGLRLIGGSQAWRSAVGWSGVALYTLIIAGLTFAALRVLNPGTNAAAGPAKKTRRR